MNPQILAQFQAARRQFPALTQEGQGFFIEIAGVRYHIFLPPDYPRSPPVLSTGRAPVTTFLTQHWQPFFRLEHVVRQLVVRARAGGQAAPYSVPPELRTRLAAAKKDEIATDTQRMEIISSCESVRAMNDKAKSAGQFILRANDEIQRLTGTIFAATEEVQGLARQYQGITATAEEKQKMAAQKQKEARLRLADILSEESSTAEESIQEMISQFTGSGVDKFAGTLMEERRKAIAGKLRAQALRQGC